MFDKRKFTVIWIAFSLAMFAAGCKKKAPPLQLLSPLTGTPQHVDAEIHRNDGFTGGIPAEVLPGARSDLEHPSPRLSEQPPPEPVDTEHLRDPLGEVVPAGETSVLFSQLARIHEPSARSCFTES